MKLVQSAAGLVISALLVAPSAMAGSISNPGDPALVGSQVIDFEGLGNGAISTLTSFSVGSVTFSTGCVINCSGSVTTLWVGPYSAAGWSNPGNALHTRFGGQDRVHVSLNNGQTMKAFGFDLFSAEQPFQFTVVDDLGSTTTFNFAGQPFPYIGYYGFTFDDAARSIAEVRLSSTANDWQWMLMDNFRYVTATPVPEPSSSMLLVAGAGLLLLLRRLRRQQSQT